MIKNLDNTTTTNKKDSIVKNLIKSKGLYCLVSEPKAGKSTLALQLANSLSNFTKEFLGEYASAVPVLYISTELDKGQIEEKFDISGYERNRNFFIVYPDSNAIEEDYVFEISNIEKDIKEFSQHNPLKTNLVKVNKLVIIDMLKDIDYGFKFDLNGYLDMNKIIQIYRKLCKKYDVTILLLHHTNKQGTTLGSTSIDGTVDGTFTLIQFDKENFELDYKSRDFPSKKLSLFRDEKLHYSVIPEETIIDDSILELEKKIFRDGEYRFTPNQAVSDLNLKINCVQFGRKLNSSIDILKSHGYHIEKKRKGYERYYIGTFEEPKYQESEVIDNG